MANFPKELKYTTDHEWARIEGDLVRIGITEHAVEQLGDVTLVDLPKVGAQVTSAGHFGDIESVKAVSELFAPITGEIVAVNDQLANKPELVNDSPYGDGWMVVIGPSSTAELSKLMDAAAYESLVGSLG